MTKHINTKHRKIMKYFQGNEIFKNSNTIETHLMKSHSRKYKVPEVVTNNVKCDKCNSQFT